MANKLDKILNDLGIMKQAQADTAAREKAGQSPNQNLNKLASYTEQTNAENQRLYDMGSQIQKQSKAEKEQKKKTDMQKKKEDALESKTSVNSAQIKKDRAEKQLEELENQNFDWTDAKARKQHEAQRERLQAEIDSARTELAQKEDREAISAMSEPEKAQLERYAVQQVENQNKPVELSDPNSTLVLGLFGNRPNAVTGEDFTDIFDTYGKKRTDEMAETYMREQNAELNQRAAEVGKNAADKHLILSSLASVPVSAVSGVVGTVGQLQSAARGTGRYPTTDPNATGTMLDAYSSNIRNEAAQNITGDIYDENGNLVEDGGIVRQALSLLYQGGISMADSIARAYLGGGALGGAVLAATNTFSQTMAEAAEKGATPGQAALLATADAFIEAATEKIPLEKLISVAKGKDAISTVKNVIRQAGIEIAEEEASLIGTLAAEAAILGNKSEFKQTVSELKKSGFTEKEAKQQAWLNVWNEAVQTALVSGISGAASGLAASAKNAITQKLGNKFLKDMKSPEQAKQDAIEKNRSRHEQQLSEDVDVQPTGTDAQTDAQKKRLDAILDTVKPQDTTPVEATAPSKADDIVNKTMEDIGLKKPQTETQNVTEDADASPFRPDMTEDEFLDAMGSHVPRNGVENPLADRNYYEVGKRNIKAYQYENPEVKPYFQKQAAWMLSELQDTVKGERGVDAQTYYESGGEKGHYGNKRLTSDSIAELLDQDGMSYKQIEQGLYDIIQDNGAENNAVAKRIEFVLNDRLMNGYTDFYSGKKVEPNADYLNMLKAQQAGQTVSTPDGVKPNIEAVGAAEQNFSGKAEYQDLLSDENSQRDRPGDVRPMEVPKTDSYDRHVSEFAANAYGAEATPDRMANEIESLIQEGALGFDRRSNKESLENARNYIYGKDGEKGRGEAATRNEITRNIANGKIKDGDIEKALLLYTKAANRTSESSQQNAAELMVDLATMANMTGRNLQMFKLLRQMTPEGQLMTVETEMRRSVEKMQKSGSIPKDYQMSFDPDLQQEYLNAANDAKKAKTPEAKKKAEQSMKDIQDAMYQVEASKLPTTIKEKWDTWRYMSMLGNAKTNLRNVAGNTLFKPYKAVKDTMAAAAERVFLKQSDRTKAVLNPLSESDRALLDWAKTDSQSEAVHDALQYSAKLGDDVSYDKLKENRQIFDNKQLEAIRKAVEWAPAEGDMLFKNDYYQKSMAGFLKARGYTATDIQSGKVDVSILNEGRTYAIQEAMKATFNDCNAFSDFVASGLRYNGDNPVGKIANIIGEGVLPFRRTPANVIVRFAEYSPAGLVKSAVDLTTKVRTGKMTAATAIDGLCSGLTGSAAMALGALLAEGTLGIRIVGGNVSEDEKRRGVQPYSIEWNWGGERHSYTIDWAAPANLPLFVGANVYSAFKNADEDANVSKFTAFLRGMQNSLEPMLSLSCLSSLNDLFESARYADEGEALYSVAASIATSYFSQGIPSIVRQANQAMQKNKQMTFANSEDPTIRDLQRAATNVPFVGDTFKTDKIDEWGETQDQGSVVDRVLNSFINPGTHKVIDNSDLEKEITRLNEVQDVDVAPETASKVVSYTDQNGELHKDVRLTAEQYKTYASTQGQTARQLAESIVGSADYAAMTDSQKAEAISLAYSYAKKQAEIATFDDHTGMTESWMIEMSKSKGKEADYIIRRVMSSDLSSSLSSVKTAWENGYASEASSKELATAYESYSKLNPSEKKKVKESSSSSARNYIEARENGVTHDKYLFIEKTISELKAEGENKNPRDVQKAEAIVKTSGLSEKQKEMLVKQRVSDAQDTNIDQLKELAKSNKEVADMYDIEAYTELYRDYLDYTKGKGKKNRTIEKWMNDYNIDHATAKALYEVFS